MQRNTLLYAYGVTHCKRSAMQTDSGTVLRLVSIRTQPYGDDVSNKWALQCFTVKNINLSPTPPNWVTHMQVIRNQHLLYFVRNKYGKVR